MIEIRGMNGMELRGAAIARPLGSKGPIVPGEPLVLVGFERAPAMLVWMTRVRRTAHGVEAVIPATAAITLGLTTRTILDRLIVSVDKVKVEAEIARMERQADLDVARHREEVADNVAEWMKAYWFAPGLGIAFALIEEAWPGAAAEMAEEVLRTVCMTPLTAIPAWAVGACKGKTPWWVPIAVGGAALVAAGLGIGYVRTILPMRREKASA